MEALLLGLPLLLTVALPLRLAVTLRVTLLLLDGAALPLLVED